MMRQILGIIWTMLMLYDSPFLTVRKTEAFRFWLYQHYYSTIPERFEPGYAVGALPSPSCRT